MKETLFSPYWYRVANLRPQLRQHVQIHRHEYRGELWYVLQDHASGRFHRFGPVAYYVVGLMDGQRTVQELWELAIAHFNEEAPSQNDMVQLLSQLHTADALITSVAPDIAELLERSFRSSQSRWKQQILSPLFVRIPLWDPNRFLSNTLPYFRPFLGRLGFGLWLLIVVFAAGLALFHWQELTENVIGRILTMQNLLLLSLLFPLVKVLHEFGHAYAVKRWGGEVHEMGVMLLVLMPIPYVEASAANAFRDKRQRMVVSAAGMMVELLLASIAFFIWLNMEEGLLRTLLYNTIFISSVSTILFNANPLLRYDGYYILADWLEIPNLAQKGMQYLGYLCKRYLLGLRHLIPPHITSRESLWLVGYTVAAFFYRIFVYAAIVLFIASRFFFVGILLAFWSTIAMFGLPLMKLFRFLFASSALHERRARALVVTGLVIGVIGWALFVLPLPFATVVEGVIWIPDEALVRIGSGGFLELIACSTGQAVRQGDLLLQCRDPFLEADGLIVAAQIRELQARYDQEILADRVQARMTQEELHNLLSEQKRIQERLRDLHVYSPSDGRVFIPGEVDLPGRLFQQGDLIGYVLGGFEPIVRVVVAQTEVDLVRNQCESIQLRLVDDPGMVYAAVIRREIPGAVQQLPSTTLGRSGGGEIPIDPMDVEGLRTLEPLFQFDLLIQGSVPDLYFGSRVYVRFSHGRMPLGFQVYRQIRQLFMKRFNV